MEKAMNLSVKIAGISLIAASTLFVVACSREQGAGAAQEEAATSQAVGSGEAPARDRRVDNHEGLPPGVILPFRHSVRVDRVIRREGRSDVRRVDIEYLEGSQESVYEQAAQ